MAKRRLDGASTETLMFELNRDASESRHHFYSIVAAVWISSEVPQEWRDVTIKVLRKNDRAERRGYRNDSLVAHAATFSSSKS